MSDVPFQALSPTTSEPAQVAGPSTSRTTARKRVRCDSDSKDQRPPEKMYKGHEDTDTDTEMDGLIDSSQSSSSSSPLPRTTLGSTAVALRKSKLYHRDERYYFEDGSCILLVVDTLFNVCDATLFFHILCFENYRSIVRF